MPFSIANLSTTLPQQILSAIQQNPKVNFMTGQFDTVSQLIANGIRISGKTGIQVGGVYGFSPNLQLVRTGSQAFDIMHGHSEWGWEAVDAAARIVAHKKIPYDLEITLFDAGRRRPCLWRPGNNRHRSWRAVRIAQGGRDQLGSFVIADEQGNQDRMGEGGGPGEHAQDDAAEDQQKGRHDIDGAAVRRGTFARQWGRGGFFTPGRGSRFLRNRFGHTRYFPEHGENGKRV